MIKKGTELVKNWTLRFDEVSNNVYEIELSDDFGRIVKTVDYDFHRAIEICLQHALDIENKLGNPINKFVYDVFKYFLENRKLLITKYSEKDFGSWILEEKHRRIILDGKDLLIISQVNELEKWKDAVTINLKDLDINRIKKISQHFEKN